MGTITHMDSELGRMMEMLRRTGADTDNTLFIFTADHGDMMGDHNLLRKSYAYEGSARIPFAVKYPKGFDAPTGVFEQVVGLQDVLPTILEVVGVEVPDAVTGQSVLKAARGEPWREFFHGEHSPCYHPDNAMQYLTDGEEKYIWFPRTGQEQLFDLRESRDELHDLAKDPSQSERVAMWRQRLIKLLGERGDGFSDGEELLIREDSYGPLAQPPQAAQ